MPCGLSREPCGIMQVVMRATSIISSAATTETDDGTMSPCRLKFTTYTNAPSGDTCSVAGNMPSSTRPIAVSPDGGVLPQVAERHAVRRRDVVRTARPPTRRRRAGRRGRTGIIPTAFTRSTFAPFGPKRTSATSSVASEPMKTR